MINGATASLATAGGRGGIAMILLAGSEADRIVGEVFRPRSSARQDRAGALRLGHLVDRDEVIDEVLLCRREESFEISVHGGPAVVTRVLAVLAARGAKVVPAAEAPEQFPLAHPRWRNPAVGREMLKALASARSTLVASAISRQWSAGISELARGNPTPDQLHSAAGGLAIAQRLLSPAEVVIAGGPNVGKSELTNALVGRPVSIVHDTPGTTRDWVRQIALIDGVPIWLTDTAGLWAGRGAVDAEAMRRARQCIASADLVLLLEAGRQPEVPGWLSARRLLTVASKCDIATPQPRPALATSARTGEGLAELRRAILAEINMNRLDPAAAMAFTSRQADLLHVAAEALEVSDSDAARAALARLLEG